MTFLKDFDSRMTRVVQENPSLSKSKRKKNQACSQRCCLMSLLLTPLAIVLIGMYFLSMYNEVLKYEQQAGNLLDTTEKQVHQQQQQQLIRKRQYEVQPQDKIADAANKKEKTILVLTTKHGQIRIALRPDLSQGSVAYIQRLVDSKNCRRCNFYRSEKPGILQGVLANRDVGFNTELGTCPSGAELIPNDCPSWDKECGCHGPLMTKGAVAWAAGQAGGPDFFIDNYKNPAKFWGTQHTNFGRLEGEESFRVVDHIFSLPVENKGGMHYLEDIIHFDPSLE